jgi:PPOX class probable F420-dependent enzyme
VRLSEAECRRRLAAARVARLATADTTGRPHIVPITFALYGDRLVTAVDQKPKTTTALKRLRNITANPSVAVLADHYADDWTQLWWVRADGRATIVADDNDQIDALQPLISKYPQYTTDPPAGPAIVITLNAWTGWTFTRT